MPRRDRIEDYQRGNAIAAWVILQDPTKYAGGMLEWAEAWARKHGPVREPEPDRPKSIEERLRAHEERAAKKKIAKRRENWQTREWHRSKKGNSYVNVNGFTIVVFPKRAGGWAIGIGEHDREGMEYSQREYPTREAAMMGAFDALIYRESKKGPGRAAGFNYAA